MTRLFLILFIFSCYLFSASSLAIVSKTKGNVRHKTKSDKQLGSAKMGMDFLIMISFKLDKTDLLNMFI